MGHGLDATGVVRRRAGPRPGRELDWQVFDREIVAAIAAQRQMREAVLSRLDERAIGAFNDYIAQMLVPDDPGQLAYLRELVRVIWGLARQGNAIILGRGANWFLNARFGLRLRAIASLEVRVERVAREEGIALAEAAPEDQGARRQAGGVHPPGLRQGDRRSSGLRHPAQHRRDRVGRCRADRAEALRAKLGVR